jgi:uncharacterized membrane protein YbhN (UPF0104 family)/tRNA A-37 threonylcarbamoyl transferase component Bud32
MGSAQTATQGDQPPAPARRGPLGRLDPRALRRADIRIFSSASDAPKARRPTDVVLLVISVIGVATLALVAPGPTEIDGTLSELIQELPGLLGWFWEICYDLMLGWALVLLVLALVARGRKRLFLTELLAGGLALGFALLAGKLAGTDWSTSLRAMTATDTSPVYLAVRLAVATAVVVMASPHMSRPLRFIGRWVVTLGAVAGIAIGVTLAIGMVAGLLIGLGSAALLHLILGSPAGRLTLDQISNALADLGVDATEIRHAPLEPSGVALALATASDGRELVVKVYGRDAWDGQLLTSVWASLTRRGERLSFGGRLRQVEHEAYLTLLAERQGVPVLPLVAAGMATQRDALLVTELTGERFGGLDPSAIGDDVLRGAWWAVGRLHDLGIAHGQLDADRIVMRADGTAAIGDLGDARSGASESAMLTDLAQLLVTTALVVGPERAVEAGIDAVGKATFADVLPFLQPAVLDRDTRRAIRDREWDLEDLMVHATAATGTEAPELEQLRRVSGRQIGIVVLIAFIAYTLISAIAGIGLANLWDELKTAELGWVLAAFVLAPISQVPQAFSTMGASVSDLLFVPVLMLQYAIQFIQLAVPSSAARVALEVRFFQRNGVETGAALSIGLIDSLSGFVIQIALILVITLSGLATLDLSSGSNSDQSSSSSSGPSLLLLAGGLILLGVVIALLIPRYRKTIREAIPRYRANLRAQMAVGAKALRVLRSPSKVTMLFLGNLVAQLMLAAILGLSLRAFGEHASFAGLVLVNTFVALFAGFMPVPGGMGVAEAALSAGLVALGIPSTAAVSTAILYRLATFYLPPLWGSLATRWLKQRSYL